MTGPRRNPNGTLQPHEFESLPGSYDVVGDVAVIRVPDCLASQKRRVAEAVVDSHRNVKSVFCQVEGVSGDFRLRGIEWVLGERRTVTVHRESGCLFKVDLEKCYFSPRLSFERLRVARLTRPGEVVVNMFAGVGCFSILMAKLGGARRVYSIDLNPVAVDFMRENVRLNRVSGKIVPILGDSKDLTLSRLRGVADRVIMPLPDRAFEYLDFAVLALKPGVGWVHYYDSVHASKKENPVEKVRLRVAKKLEEFSADFSVLFGRVVRSTGPNWYQVVLDARIVKE